MPLQASAFGTVGSSRILTEATRIGCCIGIRSGAIAVKGGLSVNVLAQAGAAVKAVMVATRNFRNVTQASVPPFRTDTAPFVGWIGPKEVLAHFIGIGSGVQRTVTAIHAGQIAVWDSSRCILTVGATETRETVTGNPRGAVDIT